MSTWNAPLDALLAKKEKMVRQRHKGKLSERKHTPKFWRCLDHLQNEQGTDKQKAYAVCTTSVGKHVAGIGHTLKSVVSFEGYVPGAAMVALGAPKGHPAFRANALIGACGILNKADDLTRWRSTRDRLLKSAYEAQSGRRISGDAFEKIISKSAQRYLGKAIAGTPPTPADQLLDEVIDAIEHHGFSRDLVVRLEQVL